MNVKTNPNIQEEIANILSEFDSFLDNVFDSPLSSPCYEYYSPVVKPGSSPLSHLSPNLSENRFISADRQDRTCSTQKQLLSENNKDKCKTVLANNFGGEIFSKNVDKVDNINEQNRLNDSFNASVNGCESQKKKDDPVIYDNVIIDEYRNRNIPVVNADEKQNKGILFDTNQKCLDESSTLPQMNDQVTDGKLSNKAKCESSPELKAKKDKNKTEGISDKFGSLQKLFCTSSSKLYADSDDKPKLIKPSGKLSKDQISNPILNETTFNVDLVNVPLPLSRELNTLPKVSDKSYPKKPAKPISHSKTAQIVSPNESVTSNAVLKSRHHASVDSTQIKKFDNLLKEFHHSNSRLKSFDNSEENFSTNNAHATRDFVAEPPKVNSQQVSFTFHEQRTPNIPESPSLPRSKKFISEGNDLEHTELKVQKDESNLESYLHNLLTTHSAKIAAGIMSVEHRGTKALELWTRRVTEGYEGVCITNMTTSWRDGLAFCALIHHFRPDLIDFKSLKSEKILENNALAFRIAEQHLGIPALLDAEDMLESEIPDRLSILTYVSQFYQAFSALGLIGPGGRRSPVSPTVANNAKNTSITTSNSPIKQASPIIATPRAKTISQPPATLQTKTETGLKTDKVTVGARGRREECVACHKQVFLAERIVVGFPGQLRHRTCFRCDRCAAQLTLASYYETEKGQFCCETCPDEERTISSGDEYEATDKKLNNSEISRKGESSCDSESDSDSESHSDLEESSSFREMENKGITPPPPPSPRTVFLNRSLESPSPSIESVPPTKPPRINTPSSLQPSSFSQLSPALCGNVLYPPKSDSTSVSPSPFSCEDAKGQETLPPGDALDTGQLVHKSSENRLQDKKDELIQSNSKIESIDRLTENKSIPDQKVKDLRNMFENKDKNAASTDKYDLKSEHTSGKISNSNESNTSFTIDKNIALLKLQSTEDNKSSIDIPDGSNLNDSMESLNNLDQCTDRLGNSDNENSVHNSPEETNVINTVVDNGSETSLNNDDNDPSTFNISVSNVSDNKPLDVSLKCSDDTDKNVESNTMNSDSNRSTQNTPEKEVPKDNESDNLKKVDDLKSEYPDELNPFDDEDIEEIDKKPLTNPISNTNNMQKSSTMTPDNKPLKNKIETTPFNPFDTDEEEEEKNVKENSKKKSLNPFWSDEEESDNDSTPSKSKVKPPRPPPPTLRWETSPGMKKYILPSNPYENKAQGEFPPPSPSLSARSSSSDQSTLRIKKKLRQAPAPPSHSGSSTPLSHMNKSLSGVEVTGGNNDDALTAKMQKDLLNHTSKLKGDAAHQKEEMVNSPIRGGLSTPKSERGEWRRKKGPAPSRPVPQKRAIRKLPMRQVAQELCDIEVKQTELERQGVLLETAIREKTEGPGYRPYSSDSTSPEDSISTSSDPDKSYSSMNSSLSTHPAMEVEDMILQLFELVNEKNELFRRQTELMYLKREKRLEEEHAEIEYQIRCLMLKPSTERSEDDAKIEEELIARLLKVVEQRDAVVNCLEMERQREAIEDESIATHMIKYQEKHIEGIESDEGKERTLKKKKKLRLIKKKKKGKNKEKVSKVDADKDVDETEVKKKKKNWFKKAATLGSSS